jgi:hypothetical protein
MTNDECLMDDKARMTKRKRRLIRFVIRASSFVILSSFVIRH